MTPYDPVGSERSAVGPRIEAFLGLCVLGGLIWVMGFLWVYGFLPQPFFYEPLDTWMDWFNTAYWAHHPGAYDTWGTIYPPLSFVILKFTTFGPCYASAEQYPSRSCDWYGALTLHLFFLLNIVLIAKTYLKIDRRTALPRAFALSAGLPMLFGLERGNLLILCFSCLILAYGPLLRSARWRWFFAGCAVNLKVYMVGTLFAQLVKRRWRWFEGAGIATLGVYLVSFAIMGTGTPMQIWQNLNNFSDAIQVASILELWYPGTYTALLALMRGDSFPILTVIGSGPVMFWSAVLPVLLWIVVALVAMAAAATAFRPQAVPLHRLIFLSIAFMLIRSEAGGYTEVFFMLFVFMEPWRGFGRIWSIVWCYILCIPAEIPVIWIPPAVRESFLGGGPVIVQYAVGVGSFLRPMVVLSIVTAMSLVTLREVWNQLRSEGWSSPFDFRAARRTPPLQDKLLPE